MVKALEEKEKCKHFTVGYQRLVVEGEVIKWQSEYETMVINKMELKEAQK